jgi:hypothetical protein
VFDDLKQSLRDLMAARLSPADRRVAMSAMRDGLVHAKLAIDDLRGAVAQSRARLTADEAELATVERRRRLAEGIGDTETVDVAEKFGRHLAERVDVLRRKVEVQEAELALAEREAAEMAQQLRQVASGVAPAPAPDAAIRDELDPDAALQRDIDALSRERTRDARNADADARLAELKRRMGQ